MARYDHKTIESKWQDYWEANDTFATPTDRTKPKYYVLDMFPYPSGSGLHVGHPKGYVATDVVARARRMMGYNVLRVMGWDSFGLPAERQAVRENRHPAEITERNIGTFKHQLRMLGLSYDWSREIATSKPDYYKWTQWIFLQLHRAGLAYQADVPVNWCPALGTVLANEEVVDGKYVETGDPVERRNMKQWMFRITEYADKLIDGLEGLDWPNSTRAQQINWIGRSRGAEIRFAVNGHDEHIDVFTTRPDTLFGGTYVVLAPEHPLVDIITTDAQRAEVTSYAETARNKSDRDRTSQAADAPKTGAFTGATVAHPVTGAPMPVWISDYVLASYGTGAVFACPAHDERDYAFAKTFDLPIVEVVSGGNIAEAAYTGDGAHVNSQFLDGLNNDDAKAKMIEWLENEHKGKGTIQYRLRDWLFSRQRYWGEPFPVIELEDGSSKVLPESALPVELPELAQFKPTEDGRPPLARAEEWLHTVDPQTGAPALRETNTMPQWAGSCWYYLRFISPHLATAAWDKEEEEYWMPVDLYVGGSEHATLHLLYARFWHKVLYDLGLVSTPEPFQRLFHQGMIHATSYRDAKGKYYYPEQVEERDGQWFIKDTDTPVNTKMEKMSKSKYNVVNPNDMAEQYGADAMRLYELFMGPLEDGALWETSGVAGTRRFLDRLWRIVVQDGELSPKVQDDAPEDAELTRELHKSIKMVGEAVESLRFNTAVSQMMIWVNEATKRKTLRKSEVNAFVRLVAPFAPHVAEELWGILGNTGTITYAAWPEFDESKLVAQTLTLAVQVNGKRRAEITVPADATSEAILETAKTNEAVQKFFATGTLRREIYVPGRLVNLVIK